MSDATSLETIIAATIGATAAVSAGVAKGLSVWKGRRNGNGSGDLAPEIADPGEKPVTAEMCQAHRNSTNARLDAIQTGVNQILTVLLDGRVIKK